MAILIPNFELAEKIGSRVEMEAATIDELIQQGISRFGQPFKETVKTAVIVVNGRSVSRLRRGKTALTSEDQVWFLLPSSGG